MTHFFTRRLVSLYAGFALLFWLFFSLTRLPVIPCLHFVADSDRGFDSSLCPLIDENKQFLFASEGGTYQPRLWAGTWIGAALLFVGFPFLAAALVQQKLRKRDRSSSVKQAETGQPKL